MLKQITWLGVGRLNASCELAIQVGCKKKCLYLIQTQNLNSKPYILSEKFKLIRLIQPILSLLLKRVL